MLNPKNYIMKLSKLKIQNFKCFGDVETILDLSEDLTALIGANSSGKSTAFQALLRLFGNQKGDREVTRSDFHVPKNRNPVELEKASFYIEAIFYFNEKEGEEAIPHFFERMVVENESSAPYLRIRLEADWQKSDITPEGLIEHTISYITVPESEEIGEENNRVRVLPAHRQLIQAIYVPAIRQPANQLKYASGTILWRLLRNVKWSEDFKRELKDKLEDVNSHLHNQDGFDKIKNTISELWNKFHSDERYYSSSLVIGNSDFEELLKKIDVEFQPTETGRPYQVLDLGDGLRSLFYLSLVCSLLKIENEQTIESEAAIQRPLLNILIAEEPENHISPHLLGKVISNLLVISEQPNVQVLLSSHTPAIIKRVSPEQIRHLRIDKEFHRTIVSKIKLPEKKSDAYKYVKEAVQNYPEIYFSNLVLIGEGDTEEVVFNRFLKVNNRESDLIGISIVPLGHRFVNHIWRLLNDLSIPHITLLDLDIDRNGGGWGRIKYVIKQLRELGEKVEINFEDGRVLTEEELNDMHHKELEHQANLFPWLNFLEKYNVYFSFPLDLDFLLLKIFESQYKTSIPSNGGPRIPDKERDSQGFQNKLHQGVRDTLKSNGGEGNIYTEQERELMIWYSYLFLGRGKPSTHIEVLSQIDEKILLENQPEIFIKIFDKMDNY